MKDKKLLNMMNALDDDLIDGASPEKIKPRKKFKFRYGMMAACLLCAVLAVNLAVLLPIFSGDDIFFDVSGTIPLRDSYETIKEIIDNNTQYKDDLTVGGDMEMDNAPSASPDYGADGGSAPGYVEITDNQVNGVIEGDLIKRTTKHIFYLRGNTLYAYSINGDSSSLVGQFKFTDDSYSKREMYLSQDGKAATIIYSGYSRYGYNNQAQTKIISINIEKPEEMELLKCTTISGTYESSRYTNNELLVFTRFYIKNTDKEENYIPSVDSGKGRELLPPGSIIAPAQYTNDSYLTVSMLNGKSLSYTGSVALLGYDGVIYVSQNNIYLTRSIYNKEDDVLDNIHYLNNKTDIVRVSYKSQGIKAEGIATIDGIIKDQYCMDEKDGVLRVFTTVRETKHTYDGDRIVYRTQYTSASLYCIDITEMKVVASVERFAPPGETVQSARFDGDSAYVCTAIVFTDPVFVFDLSDLTNITYKDTGVIEGYSHSLIELEGGYLLGIGQTGWDTLKLELYKEGETGLETVSKLELLQSSGTTSYKAHYINRDELVFGFAFVQYDNISYASHRYYGIFKIINGQIVEEHKIEFSSNFSLANCRGALIEDYYYILTDSTTEGFYVVEMK